VKKAHDGRVFDFGDGLFADFAEVSALASSNSNSEPTMLLMVSAALAAAASIIRESLSYSAMTQSTPIWDANLIFSAAC
jgi:hypothetical protein